MPWVTERDSFILLLRSRAWWEEYWPTNQETFTQGPSEFVNSQGCLHCLLHPERQWASLGFHILPPSHCVYSLMFRGGRFITSLKRKKKKRASNYWLWTACQYLFFIYFMTPPQLPGDRLRLREEKHSNWSCLILHAGKEWWGLGAGKRVSWLSVR